LHVLIIGRRAFLGALFYERKEKGKKALYACSFVLQRRAVATRFFVFKNVRRWRCCWLRVKGRGRYTPPAVVPSTMVVRSFNGSLPWLLHLLTWREGAPVACAEGQPPVTMRGR
jgi:hypothetical protein